MIYVDDLVRVTQRPDWPYGQACHMFGDDLDELHCLAKRLGLRRECFHNDESLPHYNVVAGKRKLAVEYGASEVDRKFVAEFMRERERLANPRRNGTTR